MKVRVILENDIYYSQFYDEDKRMWKSTYKNKSWLSIQNAFDTRDEAIEECKRFVKDYKSNIIWEGEL